MRVDEILFLVIALGPWLGFAEVEKTTAGSSKHVSKAQLLKYFNTMIDVLPQADVSDSDGMEPIILCLFGSS